MDFVIGNPPYVRVHNLNEDFNSVKSYMFSNEGMADLYIVFYEVGLKMLNNTGILAYITPSSFFTSIAGQNLRKYLVETNIIESVCDLKHFQPFDANTYTTIVCFNKKHTGHIVKYFEFDNIKLLPVFIDSLSVNDYYIDSKFYFTNKANLSILKNILQNQSKIDVEVKNGYATLADKVFINDFDFTSPYIIPVLKASKAKWTKIFYPYNKNNTLISEMDLSKDNNVYEYLLKRKNELTNRANDNAWYAFGRSQGINDTYKEKLAMNNMIRNSFDLKLTKVPAGQGVYSGLYIISETYDIDILKKALEDKEFGVYVSLLGKYKSGGYYTFSSKDVKAYLNYKLNMYNIGELN